MKRPTPRFPTPTATLGRMAALILPIAFALPAALARPADAQVGRNQGLLNPNLASAEELAALPQLDAADADAIIAARPHLSVADLDTLLRQHLDPAAMGSIYTRLWLPLDLNHSTEAEMLLIPGVGGRMQHEFEEYRPYIALAQFRREIGKYVDGTEVARLEQYVFVPIDLNTATEEEIRSIPGVGDRMLREFQEYRPYQALAQFEREIGKYVDDDELARLKRYVTVR
ncbi:MAG: hypothetical protein RQ745_10465 [Longimicrobiales bacterium]|nr:hypothetical protein [Longimicrobiales bacterium]